MAMEEFLNTLIGKKIDAFCGAGSGVRGEILNVENGVLFLRDESGDSCYVAIDKIIAVWEKDDKERRPGFVYQS